jgi:hypothetical protein
MTEMNNIFYNATDKTPMVDFNWITGELILSGKSIPENAAKIYEPLLNWTLNYITNARAKTNFRLNLEYFNTSSYLWISKIIKALCSINNQENILIIHLYFNIEDFEDMDDIQDEISPITDIISKASLSVGCVLYGTDDEGKVLKESRVFI